MSDQTSTSNVYEGKAHDGLHTLGLATAAEHLDGAAQRAAAEGWSYLIGASCADCPNERSATTGSTTSSAASHSQPLRFMWPCHLAALALAFTPQLLSPETLCSASA